MVSRPIPYRELRTIFLDAGNTLVAMDYVWLREELERCGITCRVDDLRRAEAAARPIVSAELPKLKSTESTDSFAFYLQSMLQKLSGTSVVKKKETDDVVQELLPILKEAGRAQRLWGCPMPGVRDALEILRAKRLQLVVVSNSDGTVEEILKRQGLRRYFDAVVDSRLVGFEKPDPRLFRHALEVSGAAPERTLHVGDMYDADIRGAWAAGLHALLLDPFDDWPYVGCVRFPDLLSAATEIGRFIP